MQMRKDVSIFGRGGSINTRNDLECFQERSVPNQRPGPRYLYSDLLSMRSQKHSPSASITSPTAARQHEKTTKFFGVAASLNTSQQSAQMLRPEEGHPLRGDALKRHSKRVKAKISFMED